MYIDNEAPEATPNTKLRERREEANRGTGKDLNKTTQLGTGGEEA